MRVIKEFHRELVSFFQSGCIPEPDPDLSGSVITINIKRCFMRNIHRHSMERRFRADRIPAGFRTGSRLLEKFRTMCPMLAYMAAYLISFMLIEHWNRLHYTVIHTAVDDVIPFVPVFIIPYLLWFPYVAFFCLLLLFREEGAYHRLCATLVIGMTVFIAVSVIFPNIHLLRPEVLPGDDIFARMVGMLYAMDTPTNLTPSIHVFNSLCVIASVWKWDWVAEDGTVYSDRVRRLGRISATVLGILITLSTMLIKQHSFSDVVIAAVFFFFTYALVYHFDVVFAGSHRQRRRRQVLRPRSVRS